MGARLVGPDGYDDTVLGRVHTPELMRYLRGAAARWADGPYERLDETGSGEGAGCTRNIPWRRAVLMAALGLPTALVQAGGYDLATLGPLSGRSCALSPRLDEDQPIDPGTRHAPCPTR